jgi:hypothetical protein
MRNDFDDPFALTPEASLRGISAMLAEVVQ